MSGRAAETAQRMARRHWLFAIAAVAAVYSAAFAFLLYDNLPALERQAGAEPALMLEFAVEASAPVAERQAEQPQPALIAAEAEPEREEKQSEAERAPEPAAKAREAEAEAAEKPAPPEKARRLPEQKTKKEPKKQKAKPAAAPQTAAKSGKKFAAPKISAEQGFNGKAEQTWADKVYRKIQMQARRMQRQLPAASGVAAVRFRYDAAGEIKAAELVKSSGNALLDAAAVKIVKKASPLPVPPQAGQKIIPVRVN